MGQCRTGAWAAPAVGVLRRTVLVALLVAAATAGLVGTADPVTAGAAATRAAWTWPLPGTPAVVRPFEPAARALAGRAPRGGPGGRAGVAGAGRRVGHRHLCRSCRRTRCRGRRARCPPHDVRAGDRAGRGGRRRAAREPARHPVLTPGALTPRALSPARLPALGAAPGRHLSRPAAAARTTRAAAAPADRLTARRPSRSRHAGGTAGSSANRRRRLRRAAPVPRLDRRGCRRRRFDGRHGPPARQSLDRPRAGAPSAQSSPGRCSQSRS
jgi:hypothetical protein